VLTARDRGGALSDTVATVSLSTVPRLSLLWAVLSFGSGKADAAGERRAVSPTPSQSESTALAVRSRAPAAFTRDQMTGPGIYMTRCSADVMGSFDFFEETEPRKTAENTAMAVLVRW